MSDLISRKALVKAILAVRDRIPRNWKTGDWMRGGLHKALRCVETAPAVDAEAVRHGRWYKPIGMAMPPEHHGRHRCSVCDKMAYFERSGREALSAYCPECGAKME